MDKVPENVMREIEVLQEAKTREEVAEAEKERLKQKHWKRKWKEWENQVRKFSPLLIRKYVYMFQPETDVFPEPKMGGMWHRAYVLVPGLAPMTMRFTVVDGEPVEDIPVDRCGNRVYIYDVANAMNNWCEFDNKNYVYWSFTRATLQFLDLDKALVCAFEQAQRYAELEEQAERNNAARENVEPQYELIGDDGQPLELPVGDALELSIRRIVKDELVSG